jgi:APA family basic amino acid/polyamine antiporter
MNKIRILFRTKKPEHCGGSGSGLKRCLSAFHLTLIGIGAIIGTGIFVLTGTVAATQTGPAITISFVIAGIGCSFIALSYAELAGSIGGCGSAYGYSYAAFGEWIAWHVGWSILLGYGVAIAAVANGWSSYFDNALIAVGVHIPKEFLFGPFSGGIVNLPAAGIILVLMILLIVGAKDSARMNAIMVGLKLITIAIFMFIAWGYFDQKNWSPFSPFGWFDMDAAGQPVGILGGAAKVAFAYIGFDVVASASEEAKNPSRDLPIGILSSLVVATVLYIVVAGLLTGIVSYIELDTPSPISFALQKIGCAFAGGIVATGALAGLTTVLLVVYFGLSRILLAIARDGLLPSFLSRISEKKGTPIPAIVTLGIAVSITAGCVSFNDLTELVNIGILFPFFIVCLGVIGLRIRHPDLKRPFLNPLGSTIPLLGATSCAAFGYFLSNTAWLYFGVWQVLGAIIYFGYGVRHSKLNPLLRSNYAGREQAHERKKSAKPISKKRTVHGRKKVKRSLPWKK